MSYVLRALGLLAALALLGASDLHGFSTANIDPACKPCQDFFRYAMGGWHASNPIPPTVSRWSVLDQLRQRNRIELRELLESASRDAWPHGSSAQKAGEYYASCMDTKERDAAGITPIATYLRAIRAIKDPADLRLETAVLQNIGAKAFLYTGIEGDPRDEQRTIAFVAQGGLGLPDRELYLAPDVRAAQIRDLYMAHIAREFRLAGDDPLASGAEARGVMAVETDLARGSRTRALLRDRVANYHRVTLAEAQAMIPSFDLSAFFRDRMAPAIDVVDVQQPEYLAHLDTVMRTTPLAELRTYLRYRLLERAAPELSMPFADETAAFESELVGRDETPLWNRCVRMVDTDLGDALGELYVEHYFSDETRIAARRMIDNIQTTFRDRLSTLSWMSDATRREAVVKLDSIADHVGYPDAWRAYDMLSIDRGPFIEDSLRVALYRARNTFAYLGRTPSRSSWSMTAPTINASYSAAYNDITLPAGLLQPPFFSPRFDDAINYGALGVVVAHELTHAFDDEGRRSDAQGNLRDWWQPIDSGAWASREGCIEREYGGLHENDKLVIGEALADLGGVEIAYAAFERTQPDKKRVKVDGWTPEQRFFLAFAQAYATFERPERSRIDSLIDPHPDGRDRVLGTLLNMPEFAAAFGCRAGDPMVRAPAQRCALW